MSQVDLSLCLLVNNLCINLLLLLEGYLADKNPVVVPVSLLFVKALERHSSSLHKSVMLVISWTVS